jgi:hypothetical protein
MASLPRCVRPRWLDKSGKHFRDVKYDYRLNTDKTMTNLFLEQALDLFLKPFRMYIVSLQQLVKVGSIALGQ